MANFKILENFFMNLQIFPKIGYNSETIEFREILKETKFVGQKISH